MKFVVKRSEWYRGKGSSASMLLRKDGMKCCIGFVGQQCGIPDYELMCRRQVWTFTRSCHLETVWPEWMMRAVGDYTDINKAYVFNDDPNISDTEREFKLAEIFKKNGDEIVFVD